jgi:hypothetical protein
MRQAPRRAQTGESETTQSVLVDARSQARDGVTLAPLSEIERQGGDIVTTRGAGSSGGGVSGAIESAVEGAQRGIENQAVPPARSDLVRRVFERYSTRARSGAEGRPAPQAAPPPPAQGEPAPAQPAPQEKTP